MAGVEHFQSLRSFRLVLAIRRPLPTSATAIRLPPPFNIFHKAVTSTRESRLSRRPTSFCSLGAQLWTELDCSGVQVRLPISQALCSFLCLYPGFRSPRCMHLAQRVSVMVEAPDSDVGLVSPRTS